MNRFFRQPDNFKKQIVIFMLLIISFMSFTQCSCSDSQKANHEYTITDRERPPELPDPLFPPDPDSVPDSLSPIHISIDASRTTGVAPLTVFFDSTGTTGLADPGFFSNSAAYMDATFAWNFDADNYDPDGKYKYTSGFVSAHVFENPGTYRVHLNVYDGDGNTNCANITITVNEFTGTTYYVSADGDDANPGTMAQPFRSAEHALSSSVLAPNVKVLFRNGDTFTIAKQITVSNETGPVIIGAYSDPDRPSPEKPVIHTTVVGSDWATVSFEGCSDIRIMDIAATATAEQSGIPSDPRRNPFGIGWDHECTHMLKYRTEEYRNGGISLSPSGTYSTIAECEFHHTAETGYTTNLNGTSPIANDGNAIIGNWVHDKNTVDTEHTEHIFRLQGGSRYFIAHNIFGPNNLVHYDALTIRGNSEKVVIYKNIIEGWNQNFSPQTASSTPAEYIHHSIMDSNLIKGQNMYHGDRYVAIGIKAKDIVIRNNIIRDYENGISVSGNDAAVGDSQRIKIYNNDFINPVAGSPFTCLMVDASCSELVMRNNLMLDLAGGTEQYTTFLCLCDDGSFQGTSDYNIFYGGDFWGDSHNDLFLVNGRLTLAAWQGAEVSNDPHSLIADPLIVNTDDYSETGFCIPAAGSPLINAGDQTRAAPAALDFYGNLRSGRDIGACEYY